MTIKEFIDHISKLRYNNELVEPIDWNDIFQSRGYFGVKVPKNTLDNGNEQWHWCNENFGSDNFTWTGDQYWFEYEEHALWFALRWS
jgi:hypothetical protein